jgi:hypothetical protein
MPVRNGADPNRPTWRTRVRLHHRMTQHLQIWSGIGVRLLQTPRDLVAELAALHATYLLSRTRGTSNHAKLGEFTLIIKERADVKCFGIHRFVRGFLLRP